MIGKLVGLLEAKHPPQVLLLCGGVGYELDVPMSTFYNLPPLGQAVSLLTHLVVREDAQLLYGFGSEQERVTFRQLIKIPGIGARTALAVLSGLSVADIAQAVATQEVGRLVKVPGIGKKTAERLLLELNGKMAQALQGASGGALGMAGYAATAHADILQALLALGYSEKEGQAAVKGLAVDVGVSDGIRLALKGLTR